MYLYILVENDIMDLQSNIPMTLMCFLSIPRAPLQLLLFLSFNASLFSPISKHVTAVIISPEHNNATDRASLLLFRSALSGDPHGILTTHWNDTVHFCKWHGITCGGPRHPERVVGLRLSKLDLGGIISPALGNLTFLRRLNLSSNNFHGQIPSELGNLPRLQHLHLSHNSLNGIIPSQLSQCTTLHMIRLDYNMLGGYIPTEFGSLPTLLYLDLQNNTLVGPIPPSLANASSLISLYLSYNQLSGGISPSFGKLSNLRSVDLSFNNLEGAIPQSLWNLSLLVGLELDANNLHGSIPQYIGQTLQNLKFLSVANNNLHGEIPLSLSNCSQLGVIQLPGNKLSGKIPPNLGTLQHLRWVTLYENHLEARKPDDWSFLASLNNCTLLHILQLDNNHLGGFLPKSVANLSSTNLQVLTMGFNYIRGIIPQEIGNLVNLTVFVMESNFLTGSIPASLGSLKNLYAINLDTNNLSGQIPSSLGNLSRLGDLLLAQNSFNRSIPKSLGNLKFLEQLDFGNNKLTGTIPKQLVNIFTLHFLFVEGNLLTGSIPVEVGGLKNLNALVMYDNKLSGEIPTSLGQCQLLEFLHLNGNLFQGNIPASLSALGGLEELHLSENNFSGKIPVSLENFRFLYSLNLSFNNFEGELPTKGIFANISGIFVLGNKNLCGGIPQLHLPTCIFESPKKQHKSRKVVMIILVASAFICVVFLLFILFQRRKAIGNNLKEENVNISYGKLNKATDRFSEANQIGFGSFGSVYKGKLDDAELGTRLIAVKVFNLERLGASKSFIAECEAFRNIRHRNLMKIITACSGVDYEGNDFKALVFDFMPNGNLDSWLHPQASASHRPHRLNLLQRLNIAIDVASALDYLHHHCETTLVHCDLKPSNILLNDDMVAIVSDFGQARFIEECTRSSAGSSGMKGTIGYMAPEYGMINSVSTNGDVYSYGILLLEMFTGKRPTDDTFEKGLSLRLLVEMAFPERIINIMDACILEERIERHNNDDTRSVNSDTRYLDCVSSVLRIGLLCTKDAPVERIEMKVVTNELETIRKLLLQHY